MKTTRIINETIVIEGAPRLDPVTVIYRDHAPGMGSVIVECYGKAWSAFWGGMGNKNIKQFLASVGPDYLAARLGMGLRTNKSEVDYLLRIAAAVVDGSKIELFNSPTLPQVLKFAERMEAKLAANRHKGGREGWLKDDPWSLVDRILDETVEVQQCFTEWGDGRRDFTDAEELANECADVANFCMMVADNVTAAKGMKGACAD